jgi:DNA-binding response OmpR family regulator
LSNDREAPNKRVLVVDGDPVNLKFIAHLIRTAGYIADTVETAEQALDRFASHRPDLMVTGLQLEGMDGFALASTIKQDPEWRSVPVILLTSGYSGEEDVRARQAGGDCSIARPVDGGLFSGIIQTFLGPPPADNQRDEELQGLAIEELRREFLEGGIRDLRAILAEFGASRFFAPAVDLVFIRKALHGWAGVGGTLGLPAITALARDLEVFSSVPEPDLGLLHRKLNELLREFSHPTPIAQAPAPRPKAVTEIVEDTPAPAPMKPVVLVADDDPTIRAVVRLALESAGLECRLAQDGILTCTLARNTLPSAIILDVNLPRMDGFQVMLCLRGMWATRKIPVILLTASDDALDIVRSAELGVAEYVIKPFAVDDLVARLQRLIAVH